MWTPEYREQLGQTQSLAGMAAVAVQMLSEEAASEKPIYMVCGPLTTGGLGCPVLNRDRFRFAIAQAQKYNLLVFDQMPFEDQIRLLGPSHEEILEKLYWPIFASGHLRYALFLPLWDTSEGAKRERAFAKQMQILDRDYPRKWLVD